MSDEEKSQPGLCAAGTLHSPRDPGEHRGRVSPRRHLGLFLTADVSRAQALGSIAQSTGNSPLLQLMGRVLGATPCASAHRFLWVVDDNFSQTGAPPVARMGATWPNAVLVHPAVHAFWPSPMEACFSILQCKAITGADTRTGTS